MEENLHILDRIGSSLANHGLKLVLAESMTAGALASTISAVHNAGDYFLGSVVCYSDEMKQSALDVEPDLLETFGGVSAEVTAALVHGLHSRFPMADLKAAVTGFAFECAATTRETPVGTVFIHIQLERVHYTKRYTLEGDEKSIIDQTIHLVLKLIDEITEHLVEGVEGKENG